MRSSRPIPPDEQTLDHVPLVRIGGRIVDAERFHAAHDAPPSDLARLICLGLLLLVTVAIAIRVGCFS